MRSFWLGMTAGLVYFWTSSVLAVFGGVPMILALVAMLLLAAYLAVYPAIAAMVMGRLISQGGRSALFFAPAAWVATMHLPFGRPRFEVTLVAAIVLGCTDTDEEHKPFDHHLSHLAVHGFLHLIGYDHENDGEAEAMESLEREILAQLGIPDPYADRERVN